MDGPRTVSVDIETAPNIGYVWGKWEQNVPEFKEDGYILCCSVRWKGEKKIQTYALPDYPKYSGGNKNEIHLLKDIWNILNEADVVIAQNGIAFDIKQIMTRFASHGIKPPSPFQVVDTLLIARRTFAFKSNKLDDIARDLKIGRKLKHEGISMWIGCMEGNKKAWKKMLEYNKHDVVLLEQVYKKFLPWIDNHPNHGLYMAGRVCPNCGSTRLISNGLRMTGATTYRRYRCLKCGRWPRGEIIKNDTKAKYLLLR